MLSLAGEQFHAAGAAFETQLTEHVF